MIALFFLLSVIWLGFVLDEEFSISRGDFAVRFAAASIMGAFWGTWLVFLLALEFGFGSGVVFTAIALINGVNLFTWKWRGRNGTWFRSLLVFNRPFWITAAVPTVLITAYFATSVWIAPNGDILYRGNAQDLAFHMATVSAFCEQTAFPPLNPQFAEAKLSYHFMGNFFSAILHQGGWELFYSLKIPMVLMAFSFCALTCYFLFSVLRARAAVIFASLLFFFGHSGVINLLFALAGYPSGAPSLPLDNWAGILGQLTYPYFNFQNIIINFFQPQLPFLFGFPLAMVILLALHRKCREAASSDRTTWFLLAMTAFLPLFHMHTFLTISPLMGLFVLLERAPARLTSGAAPAGPVRRLTRWLTGEPDAGPPSMETDSLGMPLPPRAPGFPPHLVLKGLALGLACIPVAIQMAFILSQPKIPGFSGFDVAQKLGDLSEIPDFLHLQRIWFWIRVAGAPLVLGLLGLLLTFRIGLRSSRQAVRREEIALAVFFALTFSYFIFINFYRFTPSWGDNNKFFLYLDLVLCIYAGRLLAMLWNRTLILKIAGCILISCAALAPTLIEWADRYMRSPDRLYSASDRMVADWIKLNTPGDAVFLTSNSIVNLVPALAGRRVANGAYTRQTGYADQAAEDVVERAYRETNHTLITTTHITHIMVGPPEDGVYFIDRDAMERRYKVLYDQTSQGMRYSIYETRELSADYLRREEDYKRALPYVWLSELKPSFVQQEYDTLKYNKSMDLQPIALHGKKYGSGLGTHANSEIHFALDDNYASFEAVVGLNDSQMGSSGSITFEVWVDDRKAYASKVLHAGDNPEIIKVSVAGANTLKLVVTDAGDGNHFDHADWADAKLIKKLAP